MRMQTLLGLGALVALAAVLPIEGLYEYVIGAASFGGMALQTVFAEGDQERHLFSDDWDGTSEGVDEADWIEIDGMGTFNKSSQTNTTDHAMYHRMQPIVTISRPSNTITINGWYAIGDPGQELLRAHSPSGSDAAVRGEPLGYLRLRNGVSGEAVMVRVGGGEESSNAEGGLVPVSWTLAPQTDPVTVTDFTG